jgi:ribosome modulation factor
VCESADQNVSHSTLESKIEALSIDKRRFKATELHREQSSELRIHERRLCVDMHTQWRRSGDFPLISTKWNGSDVDVRRMHAETVRSRCHGNRHRDVCWRAGTSGPTRDQAIEQAQAEKVKDLHPYGPGKVEGLFNRAEEILSQSRTELASVLRERGLRRGFTLGAGYAHHVSPYNMLDVRGSYTILGYKRVEAEFTAPRLFHRRGSLSLLGGWREATQSAFYGFGMGTSLDDRADFDFRQPYGSAILTLRPTRRLLMLRGGVEVSQYEQRPADGSSFPSVENKYTPETLPGLGTTTTYVHSQGTVGFDWRTSPGYSRRGGFYGVTLHDYTDKDERFGFRRVDYEAIQHIPILREAWVISLRAIARTTYTKSDQEVPFFLLPYVGSGSTMRGFTSHRFRDQNGLHAASGVAHHGQPLHGLGGVLRHRKSRGTP